MNTKLERAFILNKKELSELAKENLAIFAEGSYLARGERIDIHKPIEQAKRNAYFVSAKEQLPLTSLPIRKGEIEVVAEMTTTAMLNSSNRIGSLALNFASAKTPGGGWENGSLAQEESIAYRTAMVPVLQEFQHQYYDYNRAHLNSGLYNSNMIVSPGVPMFRGDSYELIPIKECDILTCAAVNCRVAQRQGISSERIETEMKKRVARIIAVAVSAQFPELILGAFGCGVFGNDPEYVASLFKTILVDKEFAKKFDHITFAIKGNPKDSRDSYSIFKKIFENT